jgi:hypothetical protein
MANLKKFHAELKSVEFTNTILCLARGGTPTSLDASLDLGNSWTELPLAETSDAEVIKTIDLHAARYPLVRLFLATEHPTIEIAALEAQVRLMRQHPCSCTTTNSASQVRPFYGHGGGSVLEMCADETGCDFVACVYWATFLR